MEDDELVVQNPDESDDGWQPATGGWGLDPAEWSPEGLERLLAAIDAHPSRPVLERSQRRSAEPGRFRPMWF